MLVVTGSQSNVRSAYSSGTPALGVGMGNVVTIVDETATLMMRPRKLAVQNVSIMQHLLIENAVIVVDSVYDAFLQSITHVGGMLLDTAQTNHLIETHWNDGHLNRDMLARHQRRADTLGFRNIDLRAPNFWSPQQQVLVLQHQFLAKKWLYFLRFTERQILTQLNQWRARFMPTRGVVIR